MEESALSSYFRSVWWVISKPITFFRRMPLTGGWSSPLVFAIVTHWLSSATEYLVRLYIGGGGGGGGGIDWRALLRISLEQSEIDGFRSGFDYAGTRDRVFDWMAGVGPVILDPFLTLVMIFYTAVLVFAGARILVPKGQLTSPDSVSFESSLRIVCFSMAPAIFAPLPWVGGAIAGFWIPILAILAVREVYRVSSSRATIIALFPSLLLLVIIVVGLSLVALLAFKFLVAFI